MENTLFVNACVREGSRTLLLAKRVLSKLGGRAERLDLASAGLLPLDAASLERRDGLLKARRYDSEEFSLAKQFSEAENIVIAAPYWDLSFPSLLKVYFERVLAAGVTFAYSEKGVPFGMCRAKRLVYVTTSGGYIPEDNFGFGYVKALAGGFLSIPDVRFFSAEGLDIAGTDVEKTLEEAMDRIDNSDL